MTVEARGRLVKDQHARRQIDGARDCDDVLYRNRIVAEGRGNVDVKAELRQQHLGCAAHLVLAYHAKARRLAAEKQILRHRKIRQQIDLLIDGGNACIERGLGRAWGESAPSSRTTPASRASTPVTTLISVDLPAPFSPSSAWISPARRVKSTSCSARSGPKLLLSPRTSRRAGAGSGLSMASSLPPASAQMRTRDMFTDETVSSKGIAPAGLIDGGRRRHSGQ